VRKNKIADSEANQKKSQITFMRIVDAAAKVFRQSGYAGAKLSDIAAAANMQTGSLYYHFDSRDQLVEEVLLLGTRRVLDAMEHAIRECPPDSSWRDKILAAAKAHLLMMLLHDDYTAATLRIFAQVPPPIRSRHRIYQEAHGRVWRQLIQGAHDAGELKPGTDLTVARLLLIGSMNWAIEWYKPGKTTPDMIAQQLIDIFFDGMGME
jgi:AcrR family transcriptional regulator